MSKTLKLHIRGKAPPCTLLNMLEERKKMEKKKGIPEQPGVSNPSTSSNINEGTSTKQHKKVYRSSNIVDYICQRYSRNNISISCDYGTRHMLTKQLFKEKPILLENTDKVFCSKWLTNQKIIFGTKCNKLMLYDVNNRNLDNIPLVGTGYDMVKHLKGIHSVEINSSKTLLATTGMSATDIVVYKVPTLEPVCIGGNAHQKMVSSMCWLDNKFLISGSKDSKMILWKVRPEMVESCHGANSYSYISPHFIRKCKEKIREVKYNKTSKEIVMLTMNKYITTYDASILRKKQTIKLSCLQEKDCLAVQPNGIYAIGGKFYAILLDPRTLQVVKKVYTINPSCSVCSVSFYNELLTIGTSAGTLSFFDLKADKYLESSINPRRTAKLIANKKNMYHGEGVQIPLDSSDDLPAIYTHCFDQSGIRLFMAGGPLNSKVAGNYVSIWQ